MLISILASAQYNNRDSNRIGLFFGLNQFSLNTSNFQTNPGSGFNAGLSVRGNYYNNFDMVYAMQFTQNNFSVNTNASLLAKEVNYELSSAQLSLLLSYKIIENHLSIEFGPLVQLNGNLNIDSNDNYNVITGTTLFAKDIVGISHFNFYPVIGLTAGVRHVRLNVSYQYGVTNMLANLNDDNLGYNFKGNPGILNANIIFYL
jgi:hypothetical protein